MNALPPLGSIRRTFQDIVMDVRESRFFRDRISMTLLVSAAVINGANLIFLALHVLIAFFATAITCTNAVFAFHGFSRSRLASFFLLMGSVVVAIFAFIISAAFGAVR